MKTTGEKNLENLFPRGLDPPCGIAPRPLIEIVSRSAAGHLVSHWQVADAAVAGRMAQRLADRLGDGQEVFLRRTVEVIFRYPELVPVRPRGAIMFADENSSAGSAPPVDATGGPPERGAVDRQLEIEETPMGALTDPNKALALANAWRTAKSNDAAALAEENAAAAAAAQAQAAVTKAQADHAAALTRQTTAVQKRAPTAAAVAAAETAMLGAA